MGTVVYQVFKTCVNAKKENKLIVLPSPTDKEFHFQNWFEDRLRETTLKYDKLGRNKYPDFILVNFQEGYEVKGLEWPGRIETFDANSQVPKGCFNGREIFYVFGRYPKRQEGADEYPVIDLIICHGRFLNADNEYVHKNKHVEGFGTYGDILIRDRKMYVVPTPFALTEGCTGLFTLIVPTNFAVEQMAPELSGEFQKVGELVRREAEKLLVTYSFNLQTNEIEATYMPNPNAGREHRFIAYRVTGDPSTEVRLVDNHELVSAKTEEENE